MYYIALGKLVAGILLIFSAVYLWQGHTMTSVFDVAVGAYLLWTSIGRIGPPPRDTKFDPIPVPSE
jgi:hypothetical protein